jgi:hypothetical protein
MNRTTRLVLSGAITGHLEEARVYFAEAERAVKARYPLAEVFNPAKLPDMGWERCMVVCRMRIKSWATGLVSIRNEVYSASRGSAEEHDLAIANGLYLLEYDGNSVKEETVCKDMAR